MNGTEPGTQLRRGASFHLVVAAALLFLVCFDSWAHVVVVVAATWAINQISFDKLHIKDAYCVMFLLKIKFLCTNAEQEQQQKLPLKVKLTIICRIFCVLWSVCKYLYKNIYEFQYLLIHQLQIYIFITR